MSEAKLDHEEEVEECSDKLFPPKVLSSVTVYRQWAYSTGKPLLNTGVSVKRRTKGETKP